LTPEEVRKLPRACQGRGFVSRRDTALIVLLFDTGVRAQGLIGLRVDNLVLDAEIVCVRGKGRRQHGNRCAESLRA
jgi:integrase/recombinase XerC